MSNRNIVVDGVNYVWKVGRNNVIVRKANGDKFQTLFVSSFEKISGMTPDNVERAIHKRYFSVTPSDIEAEIRKYLELNG
jgi:hypothetical protein